MDNLTANSYDTQAATLCNRYEAANVATLHDFLRHSIKPHARVLELGCGSGRDAAFMHSELHADITALDGATAMVAQARAAHPNIAARIHHAQLPLSNATKIADFANPDTFDFVTCLAMLMHVPEEDLSDLAFQIKQHLNPGGLLLISVSTGRTGLSDQRDATGRLLFERLGFQLLDHTTAPDALARSITWHQMVFLLPIP